MKVDIKRTEETKGLVNQKKVYVVTVQVLFSEEEKKLIQLTNSSRSVLVERKPPAGQEAKDGLIHRIYNLLYTALTGRDRLATMYALSVCDVLGTQRDKYTFDDIGSANDYMDAIGPAVNNLKAYLHHHAFHDTEIAFEV